MSFQVTPRFYSNGDHSRMRKLFLVQKTLPNFHRIVQFSMKINNISILKYIHTVRKIIWSSDTCLSHFSWFWYRNPIDSQRKLDYIWWKFCLNLGVFTVYWIILLMTNANLKLSHTKFVLGLQCPKKIWQLNSCKTWQKSMLTGLILIRFRPFELVVIMILA